MNNSLISCLIKDMIYYETNTPRRIGHFLKVHSLAKTIGELEGIDADTQYILEIAAVLHDIGIRPSIEKYHSSAGAYQELEGPPIAKKMLQQYHLDAPVIERVCYLIGHHHHYNDIYGIDYQILVEADFLVNIHEDRLERSKIKTIRNKIFKTSTGKELLDIMFLTSEDNYD